MLPQHENAAILRLTLLPRCYGTHIHSSAKPLFCFGQLPAYLSSSHFIVK
ncbi:hypothetical protein BDZ91DRAFT_713067 [Kalaharituber pfeilii]|nr:hypothetical protein BDZ91DRAFT_713067 [Kalaharituber pfeilii]